MDYNLQPFKAAENKDAAMRSILCQRKTLENSFYVFPESPEESKVQKARAVLGESVQDVPDEELAVYLTQIQYLLDSWLDQFEKQAFNSLTLKELLRERR